jgi:hypothetical protein
MEHPLTDNEILILIRALVNIISAYAIITTGYRIRKGSKVGIATALFIMFIFIAIEILMITIGLFLLETSRHILAITGRIIEFAGVLWFLHKLSSDDTTII